MSSPRPHAALLPLLALAALAATPPPGTAAGDTPVELSPFVVQDRTGGYYAAQTLAGSRLRQDLRDLGASIQVVTRDLLDDLGATGLEELLPFTTSTTVSFMIPGSVTVLPLVRSHHVVR